MTAMHSQQDDTGRKIEREGYWRGGTEGRNAHTQRKHDASLRHCVMDGAHGLINQRRRKGRMLRRVFGATLPRALHERRDVTGMREQMLAHGEREGRAWPNLALLMKNGQENTHTAYTHLGGKWLASSSVYTCCECGEDLKVMNAGLRTPQTWTLLLVCTSSTIPDLTACLCLWPQS
ncbi:hypothetical protein F7725_009084, partial [Dissostichus mawsoni]